MAKEVKQFLPLPIAVRVGSKEQYDAFMAAFKGADLAAAYATLPPIT